MAYTIHHSQFSRSVRVVWTCEELEIPYKIEPVIHQRSFLQTPEYLAVHPLGKIPALNHDGMILWESLAIMEYLFSRHPSPQLDPPSSAHEYGRYRQWFHFGEATLGQYVTIALGHRTMLPEKLRVEGIANWATKEAMACFEVMAKPLEKHDYLLERGFSAADISCGYMLLLAKFAKIFDDAPDPLKAYFKRLVERPGWKVATAPVEPKKASD